MKTEVYSWRVSTELKTGLEREARRRKISLAAALDIAAHEWLTKAVARTTHAEQKRTPRGCRESLRRDSRRRS